MKRLRIAAVAALAASGRIFASAGNAAPAAGLLTGAPVVRTLATPAAKASVEKAYWHEGITITVVIIGTVAIIGTPITNVITGVTIGGHITAATIMGIRIIRIIRTIGIIGNKPGEEAI